MSTNKQSYRNGFKEERKLPTSAVEMNSPFAIILYIKIEFFYSIYEHSGS